MKKLLLASAVAAMSIMAVQAAPTVYGKAFLTLDVQDGDDVPKEVAEKLDIKSGTPRSQLNSTGSRIGFKGSEALTANTNLVYQLEYGVRVDADDGKNFKSRDTYLGLSNKQYGTLVAGRLTGIDDYINYANEASGGVVGGDDILASFNGERANNTFAYFSPEYSGVQFMGMYAMDENDKTDTLGRDAWGVGAKYEPENGPVKAGVTYIQAGDFKAARVSGAYAVNPVLTVGGLYQLTKDKDSEKENSYTLSANYQVAQTPWTAYGQLDYVDNFEGMKDYEKKRVVIGGKYAFNKNTTGHIYSAYMKTDAKIDASKDVNYDEYGVGAGIEYKF